MDITNFPDYIQVSQSKRRPDKRTYSVIYVHEPNLIIVLRYCHETASYDAAYYRPNNLTNFFRKRDIPQRLYPQWDILEKRIQENL